MSPATTEHDSPYTHGLEKIYTIETLDMSTVRPMASLKETPQKKKSSSSKVLEKEASLKPLTLDLGPRYRGWIEPLVLREPLEVLGLSVQALQSLKEQGVTRIANLVSLREGGVPSGLGAGHYDEAMQRLDMHLKNSPLCWDQIDFASLLRCLFEKTDPTAAHIIAKKYGLESYFPLTPAQAVELRRGNEASLRQAAIDAISPEQRLQAELLWGEILDALCKPWIASRCGIVSRSEICEYLSYRCLDEELLDPVLKLMEEVFFDHALFRSQLITVAPDLFCIDQSVSAFFRKIEQMALSYFYGEKSIYRLCELITYLEEECISEWEEVSTQNIEKVLKTSALFLVYRDVDGKSTICCSFQ